MSRELNCPNCGAPLGMNDVCEYCGTNFARQKTRTERQDYENQTELTLYQLNFIKAVKTFNAEREIHERSNMQRMQEHIQNR